MTERMRILVVDDNAANVELVEQLLEQAGYENVLSTGDPTSVAGLCAAWSPDLVLLDLHMPGLSGFDVLAAIRPLIDEPESLPVLVLTADATRDAHHRALSMGARDFLTKPLDGPELLLRVRNQLEMRRLQQQLRDRTVTLEEAVRVRTLELEDARLETLSILATTVEYHDDETSRHTARVGHSCALIAQALGLDADTVAAIRQAAPLHDVGKVGIPESILRKPGRLTPDERTAMMGHAGIGAGILARARSPVLCMAAEIALGHHEHWAGGGYPSGLSGEDIPISARITAVADVFDALTHARPYKAAWEIERALDEITAQGSRQFDPAVVRAFLTLDADELVDREPIGALALAA